MSETRKEKTSEPLSETDRKTKIKPQQAESTGLTHG